MTRGQAVVVAGLVAPVLPAAALAVTLVFSFRNGLWALVTFPVWYLAVLLAEVVLGGPLLIIAWRLRLVNWWASVLAGGAVGIGALFIVASARLSLVHGPLFVGALGSAAGLLFWLIARRGQAAASGADGRG